MLEFSTVVICPVISARLVWVDSPRYILLVPKTKRFQPSLTAPDNGSISCTKAVTSTFPFRRGMRDTRSTMSGG